MATGKPFRIRRIRAKRRKPGLMRQHLTAVQAAARISSALVQGDALGSMDLTFHPGPVQAGDFSFAIGTAGSSTLVFQTLVPAMLLTGKPFSLALEGGTHNPASPCLDFLEKTYLPCLRSMGVEIDLQIERRGYYPAGGGKWRANLIPPATLAPLVMMERGAFQSLTGRVLWAKVPGHVVQKQVAYLQARQVMEEMRVYAEEDPDCEGTGHVILMEMAYEKVTEVISAFPENGKSPEEMVEEAVRDEGEYRNGGVPVGRHLADQLLVPMILGAGGEFRTLALSSHSRTNIETIGKFLGHRIETAERKDKTVEVKIPPA